MNISIHFLYTEEDLQNIDSASVIINFNPLPLYRGRQIIHKISTIITYFNPLPLYRGRLRCGQKENTWKNYFNPLPLYRGRQTVCHEHSWIRTISIHFLYTEEDKNEMSLYYDSNCISIHFLYTEEDRKYQQMNILHQDILYLILT